MQQQAAKCDLCAEKDGNKEAGFDLEAPELQQWINLFFILQLVYILPDTRRNQELAPCFSALQVARGS
jgi:hypothetical protein